MCWLGFWLASETLCSFVQVQPGSFAFPGFEQQTAADQKHASNSTFSPNSTLFPLSSIESFDSESARSQVGCCLPFAWCSPRPDALLQMVYCLRLAHAATLNPHIGLCLVVGQLS